MKSVGSQTSYVNKEVLLAVLLFLPVACFAISEGEAAPEFTLPELDQSGDVSLSSTNGKVRYLDFWASWCAPCRVSFPQIIALQSALSNDDFEVIAVNVDENPKLAIKFLRRYETNYKILSDPKGNVASLYQLPGMPTSFLLDRTGKIRLVHSGYKAGDMQKIRATIESLLTEPES